MRTTIWSRLPPREPRMCQACRREALPGYGRCQDCLDAARERNRARYRLKAGIPLDRPVRPWTRKTS